MKIACVAVFFVIAAAMFAPRPVSDDQPKIPSIGDYWVVRPENCGLSWETQIWGSRAFDAIRSSTGKTVVFVCLEGSNYSPEQASEWIKQQIGDEPHLVWLVMPEANAESRLMVIGSGSVPEHISAQQLASLGKYRSLLEEVVLISEGE